MTSPSPCGAWSTARRARPSSRSARGAWAYPSRVMPEPPVPEGGRLPVDPLAAELGERFRARRYELYLVGGVVRARFLGETGPELDFATDATPKQTLEVLRG